MIESAVTRARTLFLIGKATACRCGIAAVALLAAGMAHPASALVINPVFDSSITSLSNASTIKNAFNAVVQKITSQFDSDAQINVNVSWGSVGGQVMPSGAVGASSQSLYGYFTYSQVKSYLADASRADPTNLALATAVAHLPATAPTGVKYYVIPSAETKVLGLYPSTSGSIDGSIGFAGNSLSGYTYDPMNGVRAGTYDFQAVVAHELTEVLGRVSGLRSTTPTYRTLFDLFRYSAPGVLSFGYSQAAYFSIDGGWTNLGSFNNASSGDRGDWLTLATSRDIGDAFISTGQRKNLTAVDLTALDVLGYGGLNLGSTAWQFPRTIVFNLVEAAPEEAESIPEPGSLVLLASMLGLLGANKRHRRLPR